MSKLIACVNSEELKNAINNALNIQRDPSLVRISTMNCHNPNIRDRKTFFDLVRRMNAKCTLTVLIGENPKDIEKNYPHVADDLKRLIADYGVTFFYHKNVHAKQILVDDRTERVSFVTTANFTSQGLERNYEVGLLNFEERDQETEVYENLNERFTRFLKSKKRLIEVDEVTDTLELR